MNKTRLTGLFSLVTLLGTVACSSESQVKKDSSSGSGGTPGTDIRVGNTGASSGNSAQSTPDGLLEVSAEEAQSLQDLGKACAGWAAEPERAPSVLEFVVDISSSMNDPAPEGTDTRWHIARKSLINAISTLPETVAVGVSFFPDMIGAVGSTPGPISNCINTNDNVPIAELTDAQLAKLDSVLSRLDAPSGGAGTPTHDAFDIAISDVSNSEAPGPRFVAILTDGQPTVSKGCTGSRDPCTPEPTGPIEQAIADANSQLGIRTFLIGAPGSDKNTCTNADVRDWLSRAAKSGGTATEAGCSDQGPNYCHLDISQATDFGAALDQALKTVVGNVVQCSYDVPASNTGQAIDPNKVNIIYNDGKGGYYMVLPNNSKNCDRGWHFVNNNTQIEICQKSCDTLMQNPDARLGLVFGCKSGEVPVL